MTAPLTGTAPPTPPALGATRTRIRLQWPSCAPAPAAGLGVASAPGAWASSPCLGAKPTPAAAPARAASSLATFGRTGAVGDVELRSVGRPSESAAAAVEEVHNPRPLCAGSAQSPGGRAHSVGKSSTLSTAATSTAPSVPQANPVSADHPEKRPTVLGIFILGSLQLSVVLAVNAALVLFYSMVTEHGVDVYDFLANPHEDLTSEMLYQCSFTVGAFYSFLVYLLDMWRWQGRSNFVFWVCTPVAAVAILVGILSLTPMFPYVPLMLGIISTVAATVLLRRAFFPQVKEELYCKMTAPVFFAVAALDAVVWLTWLVPATRDGHTAWSTAVEQELEARPLAAFVLWSSPVALAAANAVIAAFIFLRLRFLQRRRVAPEELLGQGVKLSLALLATLGLIAYAVANLGGVEHGDEISEYLLVFCGLTLLLLFLYIARWVGLARLVQLAQEEKGAVAVLTSDWVKGLLVLCGWPPLAALAALDALHGLCRACLRGCGVLPAAPEERGGRFPRLTAEGSHALEEAMRFLLEDPTSVLLRAMYCGLAMTSGVVCASSLVPLLLAWVNWELARVPLWLGLLAVFFVVLLLFLFPPVAGQVIYGFATTVIVPKFGYTDGFWMGVVASCVVSLLGKLVGSAVQMKLIGLPCSRSVAVKKFIGVQTQFMKSLRFMLTRPGASFGKMATLTFGPDWPTSVLTGILDMPLVSMLVGTLPVVVVIVPCCVSFAFLLKGANMPEHESQYQSLAAFFLLLSGIIGAGGNILIAFYVQRTISDNEDELKRPNSDWMRDELEDQVLASIELDRLRGDEWRAKVGWPTMPPCMRVCLIGGCALATAALYLVLQPFDKAFTKLNLGEDFSSHRGGLLGIVNPLGWVVLQFMMLVLASVAVFQAWGRLCAAPAPLCAKPTLSEATAERRL